MPEETDTKQAAHDKGPDDFAALSDIHEAGVASPWKSTRVLGTALFLVILVLVVAAVWRFAPMRNELVAGPAAIDLSSFTPEARKAIIAVSADAPCRLSVGGRPKLELAAGEPAELGVLSGEQMISCVSTEAPAVRVTQIRRLDPDATVMVPLELAALVAAERAAGHAGAPSGPAQSEQQAQAAKDYQARWSEAGGGVLSDSRGNLSWTQSDNGEDIDWTAAGKYCGALKLSGGGWRLPTLDELQAIYDASGGSSTKCRVTNCRVSALFKLSSYWFWTSTPYGKNEAVTVTLGSGLPASYATTYAIDARALCVK
jgi:hypothetical protein